MRNRSVLARVVTKALALRPRGFIRRDVLVLEKLSARLRIEWRSRGVHPWDRDLPEDRRTVLLREQTLRDTEAAIARLFHVLPEVEAIEVRVLAPHPSNEPMLTGTVLREDVVAARPVVSPRMRLQLMGLRTP